MYSRHAATRIQVYLTSDQHRRIDQVAQAEGVTLAEVVRRAVDAYLADTQVDADAALATSFGALLPIRGRRMRVAYANAMSPASLGRLILRRLDSRRGSD